MSPIRTSAQLGAALRQRRLELSLTQAELAARVNVRQATISDLESGASQPRVGTLMDVLAALGLQLAFEGRERGQGLLSDLF